MEFGLELILDDCAKFYVGDFDAVFAYQPRLLDHEQTYNLVYQRFKLCDEARFAEYCQDLSFGVTINYDRQQVTISSGELVFLKYTFREIIDRDGFTMHPNALMGYPTLNQTVSQVYGIKQLILEHYKDYFSRVLSVVRFCDVTPDYVVIPEFNGGNCSLWECQAAISSKLAEDTAVVLEADLSAIIPRWNVGRKIYKLLLEDAYDESAVATNKFN